MPVENKISPAPSAVEVISKDVAFDGYFRIDRYTVQHEKFAGGMSEPLSREIFERGPSVGALAYDPVSDKVVLIRQFRIGAYAVDWKDPWLIETIAGTVEPGETTEAVARRETLEETGLEVGRIRHVCQYFVSPGGATEFVDLYCVEVDAGNASAIAGHHAEGEDIQTLVMSVDEALALMAENRIINAVTLIALQWLALNRDSLRAAWR